MLPIVYFIRNPISEIKKSLLFMRTQILNSSQKKPYNAPELDILSVSTEKTVLSGFSTVDWGQDPDEIG